MFCVTYSTFNMQRSRLASTVSKCQGFCQGISPFYSICLSDKIAEAVKFLEIKKVFLELKKTFFAKEKKISFMKKKLSQDTNYSCGSIFINTFIFYIFNSLL